MPITLGEPTTNPKWSKFWLVLLWIAQLLVILFLEFWTTFLVLMLVANGSLKRVPWIFTTTLVIMLISQFFILCSILYEFSYLSSLAYLTASRFFRIQLVKSLYFVFFLLVLTISGSGFLIDGKVSGVAYVWALVWRLTIFVGPFWAALGYAVFMKREPVQAFYLSDRPTSRGQ